MCKSQKFSPQASHNGKLLPPRGFPAASRHPKSRAPQHTIAAARSACIQYCSLVSSTERFHLSSVFSNQFVEPVVVHRKLLHRKLLFRCIHPHRASCRVLGNRRSHADRKLRHPLVAPPRFLTQFLLRPLFELVILSPSFAP